MKQIFRYRKLFLLTLFSFLGIITIFSQQPSNITHYMFTGLAINPAFAGSNDAICVTGLARQQWIALKGFEGEDLAIQTIFVTVDAPITFLHGGIGGVLVQEKNAQFSNIYLKLNYAYQTDLGAGIFSAGAQLDVVNTKIEGEFKPVVDDDPLLKEGNKSDLTADAGIGVLYRVPDKYYIGFSADQILQSLEKKIYYRLKRTYVVHGGYNWQVPGKPAFEVQPSAMIRTDLSALTVDISALVVYNKKFWGGLAYRYQDMASILAGLSIKGVKVGLSYDLGLSRLSRYHSGSLEIMVNYCFKIQTEKFRKSYRNTRFL